MLTIRATWKDWAWARPTVTPRSVGFLSGDNSQGSIKAKHLCGLEHVLFCFGFGPEQEELERVGQARGEVDLSTGTYSPGVTSLKRESNHLQLTGTLIGGIKCE